MSTDIKSLKQRFKKGGVSLGSWLQFPDPHAAELMARAGYDWLAIDLEHGSVFESDLIALFRAIESTGCLPFVRVEEATALRVRRSLDFGAKGIILPNISSAAQLREAVAQCLYPPEGKRGVGFCRANTFGADFENYITEANQEVLIVAQIEQADALNDLEAIFSTQSLDAVLVGPYDLSASMGLTAQFDHPDFIKALELVREHAKKAKVAMGMHVVHPDEEKLKSVIEEGYQFIAYGIDTLFLQNAAQSPKL